MVKDAHRTLGFEKAGEFPDHFSLVDQVFDLSNIILDNLDKRNLIRDELALHQVILLYIFYKATNTFLSVSVLCDRGSVGDAKSCCRKLIEMMINMKYMMDDKDKREQQYFHYLPTAMAKDFKVVSSSPDQHSQSVIEMIRTKGDEVRDWAERAKEYWDSDEAGKVTGNFRRNWSGKNAAEMAKACGLEYAYVNPYVLYSRSVHASVDDMTNYFRFEEAAFGQHFEHEDIPSVLIEAVRAYWALACCVSAAFDMKLTGSLREIMQIFQSLEKNL